MKTYHLLLIFCVMVSCKPKPVSKTIDKQSARVLSASYRTKSAAKPHVDAGDIDEQRDDYADYYVVVADTGEKYNVLRDKMLDLHQSLNVPIDTMGRTYNKVKDLIALPDDDEDEIFAGDYFQRRNISNTLSLEYLQPYLSSSKNKTIALVAGIYETKMSADSVLKSITIPNAFTFKAHIYQGCLH